MAGAVDPGIFKEALIVLAATAVVVPLVKRLKLSPILGYLVVGMFAGPAGLGRLVGSAPWLSPFAITDRDSIALVAEFGIVFLMFMIGLELSFERLTTMRRIVFGLGGLQLGLSAVAIGAFCVWAGLSPAAATVLGLALALSSTAVVINVLADQKRLATGAGRTSFAVLLFQDLAVVPILFIVGALAAKGTDGIGAEFALALAKAVVSIGVVVALGRLLLRPLFRLVADAKSPELFMAACLLVVLGASVLTALADLSMALGAFVAGLLLAETEYRREIEVTIEPFKGLLLGVFLISTGMSVDVVTIALNAPLYLSAVAALLALKTLIVFLLARFFRISRSVALESALLLAASGEFAFVVIGLALAQDVVPGPAAEFALTLTAITMALIPLMAAIGRKAARRLIPPQAQIADAAPPPPLDGPPRVIIAGFGRVGQLVGTMLDAHQIPYVAVDSDAKAVGVQRNAGRPAYFGDAARIEFLRGCGLAAAPALVLTMDAPAVVDRIAAVALAERPDIPVIARARDAKHASALYRLGVTDAVPEAIEASLQLSEAVLVDIGVPMGLVIASIHEKRDEFRQLLLEGSPKAGRGDRASGRERLRAIRAARSRASGDPPA